MNETETNVKQEEVNTDSQQPQKKENFFKRLGKKIKANKNKTIVISVIAFVLVCAIIAISCLSAFLFNRFATGIKPTDAQLAEAKGQYDRVVIIGVDGVGDYFNNTYTPNFDKMFGNYTTENGTRINASVTYEGVAIYPTISCENWMSMFHSVRPVYHGFLFRSTNQRVENGEQTDTDKSPSFIKRFIDQNETGDVLSVCTWRGVNNGVIENGAKYMSRITKYNSYPEDVFQFLNNYDKATKTAAVKTHVNEDESILVDTVVDDNIPGIEGQLYGYLYAQQKQYGWSDESIEMRDAMTMQRVIAETVNNPNKYKIAYMHLDQVDHAGHSFGYGKPGYVNAVSRVDVLIGRLYDAYEKAGMLDRTLFKIGRASCRERV